MVGEEYVPLGHSEFSSVIDKFKGTQPNVIFSTVVGDSVVALHRQYKAAGLDPAKMPMASLTTSEDEVAAMGGEFAAGHFTSAPYFMSHEIAGEREVRRRLPEAMGQGQGDELRLRARLFPGLSVQAGGREARRPESDAAHHSRRPRGSRSSRRRKGW